MVIFYWEELNLWAFCLLHHIWSFLLSEVVRPFLFHCISISLLTFIASLSLLHWFRFFFVAFSVQSCFTMLSSIFLAIYLMLNVVFYWLFLLSHTLLHLDVCFYTNWRSHSTCVFQNFFSWIICSFFMCIC